MIEIIGIQITRLSKIKNKIKKKINEKVLKIEI